jgi:hypothetical protein
MPFLAYLPGLALRICPEFHRASARPCLAHLPGLASRICPVLPRE